MADREAELIARLAPGVAQLDAAAWDRLAGGDPFLSHAFLAALEDSDSVGAGTGICSVCICRAGITIFGGNTNGIFICD